MTTNFDMNATVFVGKGELMIAAAAAIALSFAANVASSETRVVDGDTLYIGREKVRIWGLDCPERATPEGVKATRTLRTIVEGNRVIISVRKGRSYDRVVAILLVQRTSRAEFFTFDLACAMINLGVCTEFEKFSNGYYRSCKP